MTAANDNTNANSPDAATAAREWKRTPVSADLAAMIRALDEALFTTFGFDQCYVLMARDGIIAASSSVLLLLHRRVATDHHWHHTGHGHNRDLTENHAETGGEP